MRAIRRLRLVAPHSRGSSARLRRVAACRSPPGTRCRERFQVWRRSPCPAQVEICFQSRPAAMNYGCPVAARCPASPTANRFGVPRVAGDARLFSRPLFRDCRSGRAGPALRLWAMFVGGCRGRARWHRHGRSGRPCPCTGVHRSGAECSRPERSCRAVAASHSSRAERMICAGDPSQPSAPRRSQARRRLRAPCSCPAPPPRFVESRPGRGSARLRPGRLARGV